MEDQKGAKSGKTMGEWEFALNSNRKRDVVDSKQLTYAPESLSLTLCQTR